MFTEIILLAFLILLSGFFSGTEMAYIVTNKLKLEVKARKKNIFFRNAYYFVKHPQIFFSAILIGNNIVNIGFASLSALLLASFFGLDEFEILIVSTLLLLFIGEMIPKYFARELADIYYTPSSFLLRGVAFILWPFIWFLSHISKLLMERKKESAEQMMHLFDKEDFIFLIDEGHKAGAIEKTEKSIIEKVLEIGEQKVYEAIRPRTEIVGIDINDPIEKAYDIFIESGYSKIIVYEDNLDNIKGVILAKDLFTKPDSIKTILREIKFYPETKKSLEILNELLESKLSIAVVVDEFGGTAGIVTMEDIIEELFGEIKDEYDVEENICRKTSDNTYLISGKVEVDHINEKYNLGIPDGNYETLAGYVQENLGRIPKPGETIFIDDFQIFVARASKTKIDLLKVIHTIDEQ